MSVALARNGESVSTTSEGRSNVSQMFADALQGAPPAPDTGGPPPGPAPAGGDGQDQYANSIEALDDAEQALHAFIQMDSDEPDRAMAGQALQIILKLKASNQTSAQQGDLKSFTRALQGAPGLPGLR